jgi:hypothetical protein
MRRRVRGITAAAVAGGLIALAIATAQARPVRPGHALASLDRCRISDAGREQASRVPSYGGALACSPK